MRNSEIAPHRTLSATLLTAPVPSAIAVIEVRGPHAQAVVESLTTLSGSQPAPLVAGSHRFAQWSCRHSELPSEHVVLVMTSHDRMEIHCHGGSAVRSMILDDLQRMGCRLQNEQEWIVRQAQDENHAAKLLAGLVAAPTLKVAALILDQMQGAWEREVADVYRLLQSGSALEALRCAQQLLGRAKLGRKLLEPWRATLAGPPNVGKSSLLNALSGQARVLVHHQAGTTRDAIDTPLVVSDWPVTVTDTAGIRETDQPVERQGIATATNRWQAADIGLLVVDATVGWTTTHATLFEDFTATASDRLRECCILLNKWDRLSPDQQAVLLRTIQPILDQCTTERHASTPEVIATSATEPGGVDNLLAVLGRHLDRFVPPPGSGIPLSDDQVATVNELISLLAARASASS